MRSCEAWCNGARSRGVSRTRRKAGARMTGVTATPSVPMETGRTVRATTRPAMRSGRQHPSSIASRTAAGSMSSSVSRRPEGRSGEWSNSNMAGNHMKCLARGREGMRVGNRLPSCRSRNLIGQRCRIGCGQCPSVEPDQYASRMGQGDRPAEGVGREIGQSRVNPERQAWTGSTVPAAGIGGRGRTGRAARSETTFPPTCGNRHRRRAMAGGNLRAGPGTVRGPS